MKIDKLKIVKTGRCMWGTIMRQKRKSDIKNSTNLKRIKDNSDIKRGNDRKKMPELLVKEFCLTLFMTENHANTVKRRMVNSYCHKKTAHFTSHVLATNYNNSGTLQGCFSSETIYSGILEPLAVYAHAGLGAKLHISQDGHLYKP